MQKIMQVMKIAGKFFKSSSKFKLSSQLSGNLYVMKSVLSIKGGIHELPLF